ADSKDNLGAKPANRTIIEDGPFVYTTSLPYANVVSELVKKGHPVRLSKLAGHYLCEEMLYTLEHLKATKNVQGPVAFCHVPPLQSDLNGQPDTPELFESFVMDVLEASYASIQGGGTRTEPGAEAR